MCRIMLTSLVRADIGYGAERLQRVELAHDHMARDHALGADGEGDSEDDDERGGDHGKTGRDGVDYDLAVVCKVVGGDDHDGEYDSKDK